jgi:hypothetical protein
MPLSHGGKLRKSDDARVTQSLRKTGANIPDPRQIIGRRGSISSRRRLCFQSIQWQLDLRQWLWPGFMDT